MAFTLKIGRRLSVDVASLAEASDRYCAERDESGEGASTFPDGRIMENGTLKARISYNGRVWAPEPWASGDTPLFDNR